MPKLQTLLSKPGALVELFVWGNLAFLAVDICLAHSMAEFGHWGTWVPLVYSIVAPVVLAAAWMVSGIAAHEGGGKKLAIVVGFAAIVVGVMGLVLHLQSGFFVERTLRHLVYSAPFVAPLAYAGLGLLLVMNRMVDDRSLEWAQWVVLLALGGFVGNFILSLADHAQNGFFHATEWVPVIVSAVAVGFLTVSLTVAKDRAFQRATIVVMGIAALTGVVGFVLHVMANLEGDDTLWNRFVFGAPAFAPLLFPNLALLAAIGLWYVQGRAAPSQ